MIHQNSFSIWLGSQKPLLHLFVRLPVTFANVKLASRIAKVPMLISSTFALFELKLLTTSLTSEPCSSSDESPTSPDRSPLQHDESPTPPDQSPLRHDESPTSPDHSPLQRD